MSNIEVVGAGEVPLTRQQRAAAEREAHKPVLHGEVKSIINREMLPLAKNIAQAMEENNITLIALGQLLIEKGIITTEEIMKAEADVFRRIRGISPAQQEAEKAAEPGQKVERLVEPDGVVRLQDGEETRGQPLREG